MLESAQLREAVEGLYETFQHYPLREWTEPCPCCHKDPGTERQLHSKPLRELEPKQLEEYAGDALAVWGTEDDFRHFLPRLFELVLREVEDGTPLEDILLTDPHAVFLKLRWGSWKSWPASEQEAVSRYFRQLWADVIETPPEQLPWGVYDWIEAIAQAESDISPYLSQWLDAESEWAYCNLASTITKEQIVQRDAPLPTAYWRGQMPQWHQLADWLRSPQVEEKIRGGLEKFTGSPAATELAEAQHVCNESQRNSDTSKG